MIWVQAKQGKYTFPTAFDPTGNNSATSITTHLYGVGGIPTRYVIGKDGKVAAVNIGSEDGDYQLEDMLGALSITVSH